MTEHVHVLWPVCTHTNFISDVVVSLMIHDRRTSEDCVLRRTNPDVVDDDSASQNVKRFAVIRQLQFTMASDKDNTYKHFQIVENQDNQKKK